MTNMYLIEAKIEYKGVELEDFLKIWLDDVNFYLEKEKNGCVKQLWKVTGERKVLIVIEETDKELDKMMFVAPLMKKLGDQTKVTVTSLMSYEAFSNNTNEMIYSDTRYEYQKPVKRDSGLHFWAEINFGYAGLTLDQLLHILSKESVAASGGKAKGTVVDLWKCVGKRCVHVLFNFESMEELDYVSFRLPLMKLNGSNVDMSIKPLVKFDTLATHLKHMLQK